MNVVGVIAGSRWMHRKAEEPPIPGYRRRRQRREAPPGPARTRRMSVDTALSITLTGGGRSGVRAEPTGPTRAAHSDVTHDGRVTTLAPLLPARTGRPLRIRLALFAAVTLLAVSN